MKVIIIAVSMIGIVFVIAACIAVKTASLYELD